MNPSLKQVHEQLLAQHATLADQLGQTTDSNMAQAILNEMKEILHRIDLVQGLLFAQTSAALQVAVNNVDTANTALTNALQTVSTVSDLVSATSEFLGYVDTAIDIAKTLAA